MAHRAYYVNYLCRDCDEDFLTRRRLNRDGSEKKRPHCPTCGENMFTEKIRELRLESPIERRRRWTEEENEILRVGRERKYTYKKIAEMLPGRTSQAVEFRWRSILREQTNNNRRETVK